MAEQLKEAITDEDKYDVFVEKINVLLGSNVSASEVMQYAMSDVMNSYREIAVMCGASLVISFIIILLLGWIAQVGATLNIFRRVMRPSKLGNLTDYPIL